MSMEEINEVALIEAILFLESDPLSVAGIIRKSNLTGSIVESSLVELKKKYDAPVSGLELIEISGGYLLSPKESLWEQLKNHYGKKNEEKLSRAAMETMSIIAYSQPLTRAEIENIRGVSGDAMIRLLLSKGFIKEVGKKDVPGKPTQYGTTKEFLKQFRLNSIADLPKLEELDRDRFELNG